MNTVNKKEIVKLLQKPTAFQYFFLHLDKPGWFDFLNENNMLSKVPIKIKDKDENTVQSPPWWPGYYILKVADKVPGKVVELLQNLNTNENWNALDLCFQITLKLPSEYAKQLLPNIDKWFDSSVFDIGDKYSIDLLGKFIEAKDYESAFALFDILSKPSKKKHINTSLRFDFYYYKEELMAKYLPVLVEHNPGKVLEIIEKRLNEAIQISKNGYQDDVSSIWRPSIGDSKQNYSFDDAENIFVDILRDTLIKYHNKDSNMALEVIEKYLSMKYSIYKRIAIYVSRQCNITELYEQILTNEELFESYEKLPEYEILYSEYFEKLPLEAKKKILKMIQHGARWKTTAKFIDRWIIARLYKISSVISNDNNLSEYHSIVEKYKDEIDAWNRSDKQEGITSWEGPTSPMTIEEIKRLSANELVDYLKNEFKPSGGHWQPTPEGLARLIGDVVKDSPEPYAAIAERFAEEGIYPAYVSNLLRALHDAWREGKTFSWDSVLRLCELMQKREDVDPELNRKDSFDYGRFSWTEGAIADLLGEALRTDKHVIDDTYLPKIKSILFHIAEKDPNPEIDKNDRNTDYVTEAINCNRGKALEALILYALRVARIKVDKEAEKDKGPFPPGEKIYECDVKSFLENRMNNELSPAVHSTFGRYFQYLYYLDQEWIKKSIEKGLLFPSDKNKYQYWEADWQGYVLFSRFYDILFKLLRSNYKIAVETITKESKHTEKQENMRLAEHIMIALIRGLENLNDKNGLVQLFFEKAPSDVRSHAIWFIGSAFDKEPLEKDVWIKLKALWKYRLEKIDDEEVGSFVQWLKWLPESIVELFDLIEKSIKVKGKVFHQNGYYEYLIKNIGDHPKEALKLAYELLLASKKNNRLYFGFHDYFVKILDAVKPKAQEHKEMINMIVNLLGEIGDYSFKGYLVK